MDDLPTLRTNQRKTDVEHLKLLSAFHFVGVGLAVIGLLMVYGHYTLFNSMMSNSKLWQQQGAPPPPIEMFASMKWMYVVFALGVAGTGALNLLSALFIRARRHRIFSLVVAGFNCFYMPLGTALGIFTIVVLVRSSVGDLYQMGSDVVRE
jgi:hypothetical protein